ncbi:helix-turn-helix domain-containing protein [Enterococcus casseliflavus]|uniref:helix-turn-helix domain-containing protein n=1 Tax=Enterococcus casseliflavus TaxID=37734 RepID=UPI002DBCC3EF|nr:helix-turn-helix transcriptional regulator [Enterococcus casseliflavus]MEB8418004.1 helix-turn-helix domain-containing protein [Enterococcus casseliflavus]
MTTFERIKKLAKQKDKTLQQVAKELKYGENYFYSLNAGKQPTAEKLQEIADYFDVSVDYLLGRMDNPKHLEKNGNISTEYFTIQQQLIKLSPKDQQRLLKIMEVIFDDLDNGIFEEDDDL